MEENIEIRGKTLRRSHPKSKEVGFPAGSHKDSEKIDEAYEILSEACQSWLLKKAKTEDDVDESYVFAFITALAKMYGALAIGLAEDKESAKELALSTVQRYLELNIKGENGKVSSYDYPSGEKS